MEEIAGFWKEESLINSSSLQCPACRCNTQAFLDSWAFPGVAEILISGVASDCPGGITSRGQDGGILRLQRRGHYSQAKPRWPCPTLSQSPKPAGPDPIYWQKVQCQELPLPGSGCCPDGSLGSPVLLLIPQIQPRCFGFHKPHCQGLQAMGSTLHSQPLPWQRFLGLSFFPPLLPALFQQRSPQAPQCPDRAEQGCAPSLSGSPLWPSLGQEASFHPLGGGGQLFPHLL